MAPNRLSCALALSVVVATTATELTINIGPGAKECFYEVIPKDEHCSLEYQVIYGGHLDIDAEVKHADGRSIYSEQRVDAGSHTFSGQGPGSVAYEFCFSNEMSSVAHKTLYFDIVVGNDDPLVKDQLEHHQTFTQMETSLINNHDSLRRIIDFQTHHRMREATHRYTAEYMNERVQVVSAAEALFLIVLSFFQVLYLRGLFSDKKDKW